MYGGEIFVAVLPYEGVVLGWSGRLISKKGGLAGNCLPLTQAGTSPCDQPPSQP
jgi:hypothetical protein